MQLQRLLHVSVRDAGGAREESNQIRSVIMQTDLEDSRNSEDGWLGLRALPL